MAGATLSDVVDAISADLAGLSLPAHSVWLYVDPPTLRPDLGTMLAVFPRKSDHTVLATNDSYQEDDHVVVAWYVPMLEGIETGGVGDAAVAKGALADAETIITRLRTYAVGIPGLSDENEATLETSEFGTIAGAPVWAARITIMVERWPNTP